VRVGDIRSHSGNDGRPASSYRRRCHRRRRRTHCRRRKGRRIGRPIPCRRADRRGRHDRHPGPHRHPCPRRSVHPARDDRRPWLGSVPPRLDRPVPPAAGSSRHGGGLPSQLPRGGQVGDDLLREPELRPQRRSRHTRRRPERPRSASGAGSMGRARWDSRRWC
jgi:hypothetical protein